MRCMIAGTGDATSLPEKVHLDGRVMDPDEARIPVTDHGFLFGDSVFETLRAIDGRCAFADRHLARLRWSADTSRLRVPFSDGEILGACAETLAAAGEADAGVRVVVTRGSGPIEPDPSRCREPRLIVFVRPRPEPGDAARARGVSVIIARGLTSLAGAHAKTGNYLTSALALAQAREAGAYEAVLLNPDGRVTECATSNIFAVRGGVLLTPPVDEGLLPGITRRGVIEAAADLAIPVRVEPLGAGDLRTADELFLTSTLKEVLAVSAVDGVPAGGGQAGPITRRLHAEHRARVLASVRGAA